MLPDVGRRIKVRSFCVSDSVHTTLLLATAYIYVHTKMLTLLLTT